MANLKVREKATFEEMFEMGGGYVLNFSNNSFAMFVGNSVNIDVYDGRGYEDYCSKANKLRQIWNREPDGVVGTLLNDLLSYYEENQLRREELTDYQQKKIEELRIVCQRLLGNSTSVELPKKQEETLQTLLEDINNSLARNKPTLVLDRLHTFSTKLIRQICVENGITVVNNKGEFYPLHSLAGMLKKHYEQNPVFESPFTALAIQNSISLFDAYNSIRNNQSYAHDNDILGTMEASFAVKTMANLVTFIDGVESIRKKLQNSQSNTDDFELPF